MNKIVPRVRIRIQCLPMQVALCRTERAGAIEHRCCGILKLRAIKWTRTRIKKTYKKGLRVNVVKFRNLLVKHERAKSVREFGGQTFPEVFGAFLPITLIESYIFDKN